MREITERGLVNKLGTRAKVEDKIGILLQDKNGFYLSLADNPFYIQPGQTIKLYNGLNRKSPRIVEYLIHRC